MLKQGRFISPLLWMGTMSEGLNGSNRGERKPKEGKTMRDSFERLTKNPQATESRGSL